MERTKKTINVKVTPTKKAAKTPKVVTVEEEVKVTAVDQEIDLGSRVLVKWKNTGSTFRYAGKIIKPGEIFMEDPANIPTAFRDVLVPVSTSAKQLLEAEVQELPKTKFQVVERAEKGLFDVTNLSGKILNAEALTLEDAEELQTALNTYN